MPVEFWAKTVSIDGAIVSSDQQEYRVEIDQVVGHLETVDGPLVLNLTFELPGLGSAYASVRSEAY